MEKGKLADMIVVSGNPAINVADTKNIKLVIKDGKILVDKLGLPEVQKDLPVEVTDRRWVNGVTKSQIVTPVKALKLSLNGRCQLML